MDFGHLIAAAFNGPTGTAIIGISLLGALELLTGIAKAVSSGQFAWGLVDVWVRTDLAGRIVPITLTLIAGAAAPDLTVLGVQANVLTGLGLAGAAVYAAAALASIVNNVNPAATDTPPTE